MAAGGTFTLRILYQDPETVQKVEKALQALVQFGGLGTKAKNGFGCVSIRNLEKFSFNFRQYPNTLREFPSFSAKTGIVFNGKLYANWWDALGEVAIKYRDARTSLPDSKHDEFEIRKNLAGPLIAGKTTYQNDRQAKMIWLHVDKEGENKYRGKILYMPYNVGKNPQAVHNAYAQLIKLLKGSEKEAL
jgi:hypothetical protein